MENGRQITSPLYLRGNRFGVVFCHLNALNPYYYYIYRVYNNSDKGSDKGSDIASDKGLSMSLKIKALSLAMSLSHVTRKNRLFMRVCGTLVT